VNSLLSLYLHVGDLFHARAETQIYDDRRHDDVMAEFALHLATATHDVAGSTPAPARARRRSVAPVVDDLSLSLECMM